MIRSSCAAAIGRQGWVLTTHYEDAVSGASALTRVGFQRLMRGDVRGLDVVVTEAIDRLGRNLADVAGCFDQLSFSIKFCNSVGVPAMTEGGFDPVHPRWGRQAGIESKPSRYCLGPRPRTEDVPPYRSIFATSFCAFARATARSYRAM
ncbi:recombinase family protein [Acidocella sp. MX-AZ02]|uniref:recombinase family protein n=1 Tax=unclassified Acidocella TaxID=2648610 RepID=UPI0009FF13F3